MGNDHGFEFIPQAECFVGFFEGFGAQSATGAGQQGSDGFCPFPAHFREAFCKNAAQFGGCGLFQLSRNTRDIANGFQVVGIIQEHGLKGITGIAVAPVGQLHFAGLEQLLDFVIDISHVLDDIFWLGCFLEFNVFAGEGVVTAELVDTVFFARGVFEGAGQFFQCVFHLSSLD